MAISNARTGDPETRAIHASKEFTDLVGWAASTERLHLRRQQGMAQGLLQLAIYIAGRADVSLELAKKQALVEWERNNL